ncbi:MAG TPA: tail fiber domain-containing protein [Chitinophagaceae bacterium]|nr:tail fiber domain-containing protein [Chitinophagaceae bacterium]
MKKSLSFLVALCLMLSAGAQVGIGTTTPLSTLDVRGSLSGAVRFFNTSTTANSTDFQLLFNGGTAVTLTLPDATTCTGRIYYAKNVSGTVPAPVVTINTTAAQNIDAGTTYLLDESNEAVTLISSGTRWYVISQAISSATGNPWIQGANSLSGTRNLGTTSFHDLPFITNNTEKMRITTSGNVGIGTSTFNASNPEKLLVNAGNTSSFNVISGKGTIDNYLQLNIQNLSAGGSASSDIVASNNLGDESVNYIDMGINSTNFSNAAYPVIGGQSNAYLYSTGNDLVIGNATANRPLRFFTGGYALTNERMRIDGAGYVGIGTTAPAGRFHVVSDNTEFGNDYLFDDYSNSFTQGLFLRRGRGTAAAPLNLQNGDLISYIRFSPRINGVMGYTMGSGMDAYYRGNGTNDLTDLRFSTSNVERLVIDATGSVGIGSDDFDLTANAKETLLVDGTGRDSYNLVNAYGNRDGYIQLNVQNLNNGTAASSDIVATANNGTEMSAYINMGINSAGYATATSRIMNGVNTAYLYATGGKFTIGNGGSNQPIIFFTNSGATTADGTERMRIEGNGTVGIGTTAPNSAYRLHVNGNLLVNGTAYTSDARLKKQVVNLAPGLKEILALRPVSYFWKDSSQAADLQYGFLAQEVKQVMPALVGGSETNGYLNVNYTAVVPVLVNAVKEQQGQIDAQKKLLEEQQKQIDELKELVKKLAK